MMCRAKKFNKQGFSLIEIILASALLGMMTLIFLSVLTYGQISTKRAIDRNRAVLLSEEGLEAARAIRDENFSNLITGNYGLQWMNNKWQLVSGTEIVENFTRSISVSDVDAHTKQIISKVEWVPIGGGNLSINISTLLTDWRTASSTGTSSEFCSN